MSDHFIIFFNNIHLVFMKLYRGLKDILFKTIDPYFKNESDEHLVYGKGTSYSKKLSLAEDYCQGNKWGWLLTYSLTSGKEFQLNISNIEDEDTLCNDTFYLNINNDKVLSKELSSHMKNLGYDYINFCYDEYDPHIIVLTQNCKIELEEVKLWTQYQPIVDIIKKLNYPFDGEFFSIPLTDIPQIDNIISKFN